MGQRVYKLEEGGLQERFQNSRAKIQMYGGGFGNGKTTTAVIKALKLARAYPGSNGLIARSTYPKLNDTIRKEFIAWCPAAWIKRKALTENIIELKNGSVINFRYIAQQGKNAESSTSNLLSATYDWIVVDQLEDPEITHKDFLDLLGRLRGSTPYDPAVEEYDETMPKDGPRWMMLMCNPTRNWVYRELVKPLHDFKLGLHNPKLLAEEDDEGTLVPIIELFEGSTYENKANLSADFIKTLETTYKGQMRDRFLLGQWAAYEGLVYPQYDTATHVVQNEIMYNYFQQLVNEGFLPTILEAYDHGIAKPACYGLAFADHMGVVNIIDGIYKAERTLEQLAEEIRELRAKYGIVDSDSSAAVLADPAVFRRATGNAKTVGVSVAGLFREQGIIMSRGNNDIINGIAKVQSYLAIDKYVMNPYTQEFGSPRLFVSDLCPWFDQEITDYYWRKDVQGAYEDEPMDRNDHAMDMSKYLLSKRPRIASLIVKPKRTTLPAQARRWSEQADTSNEKRNHRYA